MSITGYGHTFNNEKDKNAYAKMKSESRARALARKKEMNPNHKEDAEVRKHFRNESKRFSELGYKN